MTVLDPAASSSFQPYGFILGLMLYDVLLFVLGLHWDLAALHYDSSHHRVYFDMILGSHFCI